MAVQQNRKTRSKRDKRRTHQKIPKPAVSMDSLTGDMHLRHHVSAEGFYRGKQVVEVNKKNEEEV